MRRRDPILAARLPPPPVTQRGPIGDGPIRIWDADGRLDFDSVCRLVDAANVVVDGRVYKSGIRPGQEAQPVFLGTALLTVDLSQLTIADGPVNESMTRRLRDAFARDRRTIQPLRDRAWQEAARILGPDTPSLLEVTPTILARGASVVFDMDLEWPVERCRIEARDTEI